MKEGKTTPLLWEQVFLSVPSAVLDLFHFDCLLSGCCGTHGFRQLIVYIGMETGGLQIAVPFCEF